MVNKIVAEMFRRGGSSKTKFVPKIIILRGDTVQSRENSLVISDVRYRTSIRIDVLWHVARVYYCQETVSTCIIISQHKRESFSSFLNDKNQLVRITKVCLVALSC